MEQNQIIRIWMIVYDGDANRIYSFTNFDKALASIEGSVRSYFCHYGDDDNHSDFDDICDEITNKVRQLRNSPCIPMKFDNLQMVVYNWEIDNTNPIHKILVACHDDISDLDLKEKIAGLFSPSVL